MFGEMEMALRRLKVFAKPQGRNLVANFNNTDGSIRIMQAIIVISSVPKSVPEWII